ncbi:MAG: universal stress protein [Bacteroidia bacterium]|nr:universal stress protein [Bacteroidia bacterium]NNF30842.1 universal stress protein [Flavobacteriaceae bacterium]MBT8275451.1 universal stress protein [Bacteroidia bacterium]NNJ81030.1 universal stress protein [Flavobacteriaceae bacterium]NNK54455.1 universal stress protein [Flavobacteriaceae bacterium]
MRKVLIPTDFSDNAMNAIKYAMELFKYDRTDFYIMHAYGDDLYSSKDGVDRESLNVAREEAMKNTNTDLEKVIAHMKEVSPNPRHNYFPISVFGALVDEANEIAELENVDVIVMGTKGKSDDRNLTFGSNTLQVIKYVKCPVLAVPAVFKDIQPANVLFATDYMLPYQRRELKLMSTIIQNFAAKLKVLHISKFDELSFRQQDNKAFLEYCMEQIKPDYLQLAGTDITNVINNAVESYDIDLLVMINSRHSFLEDFLYTSKVEKIGLEIKIPFLVLQNLPRN